MEMFSNLASFSEGVADTLNLLESAYIQVKDTRDDLENTKVETSGLKSLLDGAMDYISPSNKGGGDKIKIQFNPSSLSFSYSNENADDSTSISKSDGKVEDADSGDDSTTMTLSMNIVFDRSTQAKEANRSVKPDVDQFLAMVKNPYVREVTFFWGKQYYRGVVKKVDATYNLFNKNGLPMRANIAFSMEMRGMVAD